MSPTGKKHYPHKREPLMPKENHRSTNYDNYILTLHNPFRCSMSAFSDPQETAFKECHSCSRFHEKPTTAAYKGQPVQHTHCKAINHCLHKALGRLSKWRTRAYFVFKREVTLKRLDTKGIWNSAGKATNIFYSFGNRSKPRSSPMCLGSTKQWDGKKEVLDVGRWEGGGRDERERARGSERGRQ